jgi:hypothetical protein
MARKSGMNWGCRSSSLLSCVLALLSASAAAGLGGCNREGGEVRLFDGPEVFFDLRVLPDLHLTISAEARASLAKKPRVRVSADLAYSDRHWQVGLRIKGHRSLRKLGEKPSFNIDVNWREKEQRFFGKKSVILNNLVEDPTMVRELLAYRLHRELGVPAPEVGYARVFLDDLYLGLYLYLEPIDDRFLKLRFADRRGELYEPEYGCDVYPEDAAVMEVEEGEDRAPLAGLAAVAKDGPVGGLIGGPGSRFHPSALTYLAISTVIGDFDGYRHGHNYRLYREPSLDRWFFIPWGLDRAFKRSLDIYDSAGLVARRCFADRDCRVAYLGELGRVADTLERLAFDRSVDAIYGFIADAVKQDRRRPYNDRQMKKGRADLIDFLRRRPGEIRAALSCLGADGAEIDGDGDGFGCLDCDDRDPAVHPGAAELCDGRDNDCSRLVDDAAACACPETVAEGVRYALCDLPMPWADAARMCTAKGGALARLDSEAASRAVYDAANRVRKERWWIGLRAEPGKVSWADGAPVAYLGWSDGEPDDDGCNQDCVSLGEGKDGRWQDLHCGQPAPFICRLPPATSAAP